MRSRIRIIPLLATILLASGTPLATACSSDGGGPTGSSSCCKVCKTGKACGDTCIARSSTCSAGRGCACNG